MRSKQGNYTPREAALVILAQWAEAAMRELTTDIVDMDHRESYRQQLRSSLEKEKVRLLARVSSPVEGK
jgi:hypothetical protein